MEILLRVKDKNTKNRKEFDWVATKRGDIIVVMPDGHLWGTAELSNPEWRIIRLPGVPWEVSFDWAEPAIHQGSHVSLARKYRINLECDAAKWLRDAIAMNGVITLYEHEYPMFFALKEPRNSPIPEIICPQ